MRLRSMLYRPGSLVLMATADAATRTQRKASAPNMKLTALMVARASSSSGVGGLTEKA